MNEVVIISKKIDKFITLPENTNFEIIKTGNIKDVINEFLSKDKKFPLLAAIFIHADDYNELFNYLNALSGDDIIYEFVLLGSIDKLKNHDFNKLYSISEFRSTKISSDEFDFIVHKTFSIINEFKYILEIQGEYLVRLNDTRQDQDDLIDIGKALSSEKDPDKLLRLILFLSKKITGADAGSIYLVEEDEDDGKRLRFKYSKTNSREVPLEEFTLDFNKKSIAGYVAVTGEVLNIPDSYSLPKDSPYTRDRSFDEKHNYPCRSMLVVPMRNHIDEIIGVIQLINSKEDINRKTESDNDEFEIMLEKAEDFDKYVVTFDKKYDSLLESIAGEAAIAIENNRMIKQIQQQFEEFVKASVTAIESRDPATSGHSFRVAEVCKAMARAINEENEGYYKDTDFPEIALRELEFAALLHDFGKVYIDYSIFQKAKKLFPKDCENLILRLDYLYRFIELKFSYDKISVLNNHDIPEQNQKINQISQNANEKLNRIKSIKEELLSLNEPTVMIDDPGKTLNEIIKEIEEMECVNIDGKKINIITENDKINLSIKKGSLNEAERKEIESHVVRTHSFVSRIPWPPEYKNIPEIALRHHETIDGAGYPNGIKGRENTLLQSRIMSIADIFDALIASDRPYKKAMPLEKVLKILGEEADMGKLDKELVDIFIKHKIYEKVDKDSFKNE